MVRRALPVALLLLGAACDQSWKPASVIDSLRVIGVRGEPPEVRPGEPSSLQQLLLDPTRAGKKSTTLWLGCEPDPYGAGRGACGDLDTLKDPTAFADATKLPQGIRVIGIDDRATYFASPTLFDVLEPGDMRRQLGTVGTVISIAVAEDVPFTATREELQPLLEKVQSKEIPSQLTIFRVRVSEAAEAVRNHNPAIDDLIVAGETLPRGATVQVKPLEDNELDLTAHDFEEYDSVTPTMTEHKTERIVTAWYTSAGRFTSERVALGSEVKTKLTGPGDERSGNDPIPENRRGSLWAVIRDSRGGQAWQEWKWWACDASAPAPAVTSADFGGTQLVLRGENLDQLLDVVAGTVAVRGAYSAISNTWTGDAVPSGPLTLRTKSCVNSTFTP